MIGRILVLGGSGLLGQSLTAALMKAGRPFDAPARQQLDLAGLADGRAAAAALASFRPRAVINAVSFSDVAAAESPASEPEVMLLNRDLPGRLARGCREMGIPFVHLSTDYLFDGAATRPYLEADRPNPLQVYGRSKWAGEQEVMSAFPAALIARTSTLFGPGPRRRPHYVDAILRQARAGGPLEVVVEPIASPTYAPDLAEGLLALLDRGASGVVNVVNEGCCSRLELARAAVAAARLGTPVEVRPRAASADPPIRPAFSALDPARYATIVGKPLRPWRHALRAYLALERGEAPGQTPPSSR